MNSDHPPAVVGAGFSGLSVARFLAKAGCRPHLYEEHGRVGFPKHCTGIVSTQTMELIGEPARECHLHSYHAITVEGTRPPGFTVEHKNIAHMLERVCLEQSMLREAVQWGVQYTPHTRVTRVEEWGSSTTVWVEGEPEGKTHSHTILALGSRPPLLHPLLKQERRPPIPGVNLLVEAEHGQDPGEIRVFFDHSLAPGFFAWSVPLGSDRLVVGLATQEPSSLRRGLDTLLKERLGLRTPRTVEAYGGPVNRGPPLKRLRQGPVMLAGDSAGLVKPVTGGGLYPMAKATGMPPRGVGCGQALELLASRLEQVRRELLRQYKVARLLHDPGSQGMIDRAIDIARRERLGGLIGEKMGFDSHHLLARVVLSRPKAAILLALTVGWRGLSLIL